MSYASDRSFRRIVYTLALVAFPIVLVIYAFSSCDVRKRSEKRACRNGDVEQCLQVGKYYEAKADGILGFAMSNSDTATVQYYRACVLGSSVGCERMVAMDADSNSAKNSTIGEGQIADALIDGCIAAVAGTCVELWTYMEGTDWVANRSAAAFDVHCVKGEGEACYGLGHLVSQNLGGQANTFENVLRLYDQGCTHGSSNACTAAQDARAQQAKQAADATTAAEAQP